MLGVVQQINNQKLEIPCVSAHEACGKDKATSFIHTRLVLLEVKIRT